MDKLLIIGDSFNIPRVIESCKNSNIYTIVTDNNPPEISKSKYLADEYWMINVLDLDALEKQCRKENVTGIFSITSDFCGDVAVELCKRLGIKYYTSEEAHSYERSKNCFKEMCGVCGLKVAPDYTSLMNDISHIEFPVVVKPTDSSANRGQSICFKEEEIQPAIEHAKSLSASGEIVIEKYLRGEEIFAMYAMNNGHIALSLFCGVYVNEGEPKRCYSVTCNRSKHLKRYLETVNDKVIMMLKKMGCKQGTAFVSSVAEEDDFYFLEMGYRLPGGLIQIGYEEMTGLDYTKLYLDYTLHGTSDFPIIPYDHETESIACSYIIWSHNGIIGKMEGAEDLQGERISVFPYKKLGDAVGGTTLKDGPVYLACFAAESDQDYSRKMEIINDALICEDVDGNDLLIRFNNYKKIFEKG